MPMNVHLNNVSSAAEPSVTKIGIMIHPHGPEFVTQKDWFAVFKFRAHLIKYDCFCYISGTANLFVTKFN